ncbi:MAG TPA: FecR domain-containing protein [Burkholderiales bacterium]|nr:FecR domain-containing protein [Burkholderiales bacterium]
MVGARITKRHNLKRYLTFSLLAVACLGGNAWAQGAGTVDLSDGTVAVTSVSGSKQAAFNGLGLNPGDTIETGGDGELHAVLTDGGFLAVRPNTVVKIAAFSAKGDASDETWIDLVRGALRAVTGWIAKSHERAYKITTPTANVGVRGTNFEVVHIPEGQVGPGDMAGTHNWVHEGTTILQTQRGQIEVGAGQAAYALAASEAPRRHDGIPAFLQKHQGKFDGRIEQHARHIDEHMTKSLRERGLLKEGETVDKYIERSRMQPGREQIQMENPRPDERSRMQPEREQIQRENPRPERPERPHRPEKPERK